MWKLQPRWVASGSEEQAVWGVSESSRRDRRVSAIYEGGGGDQLQDESPFLRAILWGGGPHCYCQIC